MSEYLGMLSPSTVIRWLVYPLVGILALCVLGCGSGPSHPVQGRPEVAPDTMLPTPGDVVRTLSFVDADRLRRGSDFAALAPLQRVTAASHRARFSPDWDSHDGPDPSGLAFAIYSFSVDGYDLAPELHLRWCIPPADPSQVWVGLSSWEKNNWEWHVGTPEDLITLGPLDDNIGAGGILLVAIVLTGEDECVLDCLRLGPLVGEWVIETVAEIHVLDISLVLDSAGHPHIAVHGQIGTELVDSLYYARFDGYNWSLTALDESGDHVGQYPSIALDSDEWPHIVYRHADLEELRYIYFDGNAWQSLEMEGRDGVRLGLAIDSADIPHIAYFDGGNLIYSRRSEGEWQDEPQHPATDGRLSLTLDEADNPYIAYYTSSSVSIRLRDLAGTEWRDQDVQGPGIGYYTPGVAVLPGGQVAVCYTHNGAQFEIWSSLLSGQSAWEHLLITSSDTIFGTIVSLALDSQNGQHVSYCHCLSGEVRYAHFDGAEWRTRMIDGGAGITGISNAIAVDSYDRPCIAYDRWDATTSYLRYAYRID